MQIFSKLKSKYPWDSEIWVIKVALFVIVSAKMKRYKLAFTMK